MLRNSRLAQALTGNAYALLTLVMLFWGGNTIAGRLAVGEVSPMAIVTLRWLIVCVLLLAIRREAFSEVIGLIKARPVYVAVMGTFGFTGFNVLFYIAAYHTTALNIGIIQGSIPVFVLVASFLALRVPIRAVQLLGIGLTAIGVALIAGQGDLARLAGLSVNFGDALMLIACAFYGAYTVGLRQRPNVSGLTFFTALALAALVSSLPMFAFEIASGHGRWPTTNGWLIILYISLFPSLLAQIWFMRGVELIGPSRAGVFVNLVPGFAALLAVGILGERFAWYHGAGLALVLGGIWLSERTRIR